MIKQSKNSNLCRPVESFKLDTDLAYYYRNSEKKGFKSKTEFINKSMRMMIGFKENPAELLKILKERNPELYKKIGRKRF